METDAPTIGKEIARGRRKSPRTSTALLKTGLQDPVARSHDGSTSDESGVDMTWRTRLFEFPGGVLEVRATDDDSDDNPGVYLEFQASDPQDEPQEAVMRWKPTCIGYLRMDVSGLAMLWDQSQVRRLADRLGYDFADFVIYDPRFGRPPLARLKAQATRLDAEAVIVPSPEHFEGGIPETLVRQLDVITVSPEETFARRATPPLRDLLPHAKADGA